MTLFGINLSKLYLSHNEESGEWKSWTNGNGEWWKLSRVSLPFSDLSQSYTARPNHGTVMCHGDETTAHPKSTLFQWKKATIASHTIAWNPIALMHTYVSITWLESFICARSFFAHEGILLMVIWHVLWQFTPTKHLWIPRAGSYFICYTINYICYTINIISRSASNAVRLASQSRW